MSRHLLQLANHSLYITACQASVKMAAAVAQVVALTQPVTCQAMVVWPCLLYVYLMHQI